MNLIPKTTAFIFPGQGSQAVGMGKDLAVQFITARQLFDEADSHSRFFPLPVNVGWTRYGTQ